MNLEKAISILGTKDKDKVKSAYRKLSLKYHPDKGGSSEKFHLLTDAYEFILNHTPVKKIVVEKSIVYAGVNEILFGGDGIYNTKKIKLPPIGYICSSILVDNIETEIQYVNFNFTINQEQYLIYAQDLNFFTIKKEIIKLPKNGVLKYFDFYTKNIEETKNYTIAKDKKTLLISNKGVRIELEGFIQKTPLIFKLK